jgi:cyclin B
LFKDHHLPQDKILLQQQPKKLSQETFEMVAQIMEDRRKERMKTLTRNLEVCDLLDMRNPQSVAEFAPQIYKNMHLEEVNHMYPKDFMSNQSEVTEKMRAYLIDWLTELHIKFKLWPETLFVCVGLIDKFLLVESDFKKKELQCLGLTALHIAGKYEEIYPPSLKDLLRVTDNAVTKD